MTRLSSGLCACAVLSSLASASFDVGFWFQKYFPSLVIVTTNVFVTVSSDDAVRGSSTLRLCETMYVAATIRMMSSTSMMSTMGVMLMPVIGARDPRAADDMDAMFVPSFLG